MGAIPNVPKEVKVQIRREMELEKEILFVLMKKSSSCERFGSQIKFCAIQVPKFNVEKEILFFLMKKSSSCERFGSQLKFCAIQVLT